MHKLEKLGLGILTLVLIIMTAVFILLKNQHHQTITSYEDATGWFYQCSTPIEAKEGTVGSLGHSQGLIPADESEASRYCHKVGIE